MDCKHFGSCGSCKYDNYEEQFQLKKEKINIEFKNFFNEEIETFTSPKLHFRSRGEFRIFHNDSEISYAMFNENKKLVLINECKIVTKSISELMPKILNELQKNEILNFKLFGIEFLNSVDDMLVTLIYHRKLEDDWIELAKELELKFNINIIGRSKKQKIILSKDFINSELNLGKTFKYKFYEGGFTQPNSYINKSMIEWVLSSINSNRDLLELYCGAGNFTLPLSTKFNRVLATEISKTSIKSALENVKLNSINNIDFIRLSAEEFVEAINGVREFNRLKEKNIDLNSYNFSTIFLDPPRAGLNYTTRDLAKNYENIIYISCNPITLKRDLTELLKTHSIQKFAMFDQFPYTNHIESGIILKINNL